MRIIPKRLSEINIGDRVCIAFSKYKGEEGVVTGTSFRNLDVLLDIGVGTS